VPQDFYASDALQIIQQCKALKETQSTVSNQGKSPKGLSSSTTELPTEATLLPLSQLFTASTMKLKLKLWLVTLMHQVPHQLVPESAVVVCSAALVAVDHQVLVLHQV